MTSQIDYKVPHIVNAYQAFISGDRSRGFKEFLMADTSQQNKAYEQIWINRNKPPGDPEYGRNAFNDIHGKSSTLAEKAKAIETFADKYHQTQMTGRVSVYRNVWNDNRGGFDRVFSHTEHRPSDKKTREGLEAAYNLIPEVNVDPETKKNWEIATATALYVGSFLMFVAATFAK